MATLHDDMLASGSYNGEIRIWSLRQAEMMHTLSGHTGCVHSLTMLFNDELVSSADDQTARVWCIYTGRTLRSLQQQLPGDARNLELHAVTNMLAWSLAGHPNVRVCSQSLIRGD